jgi:hypothetical protein
MTSTRLVALETICWPKFVRAENKLKSRNSGDQSGGRRLRHRRRIGREFRDKPEVSETQSEVARSAEPPPAGHALQDRTAKVTPKVERIVVTEIVV